MGAKKPAYSQAVLELAADMVTAFGDGVHRFGLQPAKSKSGGTKAVGVGEDQGKKPKYGKAAERALAGGQRRGKQQPKLGVESQQMQMGRSPDPEAAATVPTTPPLAAVATPYRPARGPVKPAAAEARNRQAYNARQYKGEKLAAYAKDVDYTKPMGPAGAATKAPAISPAETKAIEGYHAKDTQTYGPRAAGILRSAAYAVRGLFTLGGLVGGTGFGAQAGTIIGGLAGGPPGAALGMALGTALGGGLGGLAGSKVRLPGVLATAEASQGGPIATRKAFRVKNNDNLPWRAQRRIEGGFDKVMARKNRELATTIAEGEALRAGRFSESFAEDGLPPNAVAVLKVRLKLAARKAGVALPPIPDDVIAQALALAGQDASTQATASNLSECVKLAERINRR